MRDRKEGQADTKKIEEVLNKDPTHGSSEMPLRGWKWDDGPPC